MEEVDEGGFVDAIQEGKIVKVPESIAKQEGLLILRKSHLGMQRESVREEKREAEMRNVRLDIDDFRKPLNWKKNQVVRELVDNFHWEIVRRRRELDLTRKELAANIGIDERKMMLIENGVIPGSDFVLVNKIQKRLGINLRKDRKDFTQEMRELVDKGAGVGDGGGVEGTPASRGPGGKGGVSGVRRGGEAKAAGEKREIIGDEIEIVEDDNI